MRIEVKNLTPKVVQNEATQREMDLLNSMAKDVGARRKMNYNLRCRLRRIEKYGEKAIFQNKFQHPEPEMAADVPTFENPSGIKTITQAEEEMEIKKRMLAEVKHEPEKRRKMVEEFNSKLEQRRYDEAGDPISFKTEELDEKAFIRIIKEIKSGVSPYQACINKRVLADEFFKACKENPKWQKELDDAREVYAESQVSRMEKLSHQLERNAIDIQTYNSICNNIRWLAEKLFPVLYGNKTKVETSVTHNLEISQDKLRELNDLLRENKPLEVEYQEV